MLHRRSLLLLTLFFTPVHGLEAAAPPPAPVFEDQLATWFRHVSDIVTAPDGRLYVCGSTGATFTDLPIVPLILGNPAFDGSDNAFVACLSPGQLPVLQGLVVFGGTGGDFATSIDIETDLAGAVTAVHVAGTTASPTFPVTTGPAGIGSRTGFWLRFDHALLLQAACLVAGPDTVNDLRCLGNGEALLCGYALPGTATGIMHGALGGADDGILLHGRLSDAGGGFAYAELRRALIGGDGRDVLERILVAPDGSIFVAGFTQSSDFPTVGAFKAPPVAEESGKGKNKTVTVQWDMSLARLTPQFVLSFCSPIGGSDSEAGAPPTLALSGQRLAMVGSTLSADFVPAPQGVGSTSTLVERDAVMTVFDIAQPGAPVPIWCSFLGGSGLDRAHAVAFDAAGRLHVGGFRNAPDPTTSTKGKPAPSPPPPIPFPVLDNGNGLITAKDPSTGDGGFYCIFAPVSGGYQMQYASLTAGWVDDLALGGVAQGEAVSLGMRPVNGEVTPVSPTANAPLSAAGDATDSFLLVTGKKAN